MVRKSRKKSKVRRPGPTKVSPADPSTAGDNPFDALSRLGSDAQIGDVLNELLRISASYEELAPMFHAVRGMQRLQEGDWFEATNDMEVALRSCDDFDDFFVALLRTLCAFAKLGMHSSQEALGFLNEAIRNRPQQPNLLALRGYIYAELGDLHRALKEVQAASDLFQARKVEADTSTDPELANLPVMARFEEFLEMQTLPSIDIVLADIYFKLGNSEEALKHLLKVASYDSPALPSALVEVAKGLIRLNEFEEAMRVAHRLEREFPEGPDHHFIKGLVKLGLDDHSAVDEIDQAILKSPQISQFSITKVSALFSERDPIGALKTLNRLLAMKPGNPYIHLLRGVLCLELDDVLGALRDLEVARDLLEKISLPHFFLAISLSRLARESDAEASLKRGLGLDNISGFSQYAKGMVDFNLGRGDNGIASLESAVQRDPSDGEAWFSLGLAYQRVGRYLDALSSLSKSGQNGHWKAYDVIKEIQQLNRDWKIGPTKSKIVWNSTLKEAAFEILAVVDVDQKQSPLLRRFANLRDASDQFFEGHSFPKRHGLTKKRLYDNVIKASLSFSDERKKVAKKRMTRG